MRLRYYLMKLFYYCFIYSCPKGPVREVYEVMFKNTKDFIIKAVNENNQD